MGSEKQPLLNQENVELSQVETEKQITALTDIRVGLSSDVVTQRMLEYGPNELTEKKVNPIMMFLAYLWGPMPIMIWAAAIVEFAKAIKMGDGWIDFGVLLVLQFANATIGFIEEHNAGNAIAALKQALAPQCHVCRNGEWFNMPARDLVPGDLIEIKLGDIVPADAILLPGAPVQADQAALTGESLPVTIHPGEKVKMGSAIKRGESRCVVVATGKNTFFGKAAEMIASVVHVGRFQKILFAITLWLLILCLVFSAGIFIKLMLQKDLDFMHVLSVVVVIFVASIPVAIEVVCTSTLAVGSRRLSEKKVIVARLSAIEELAGMTILCSDKTGTLTLNKLSLREPIRLGEFDDAEIIFYSALASKRDEGNQDAIDFCITRACTAEQKQRLSRFEELDFFPFNPTDKRTEATVRTPEGTILKVSKGAPQVILRMAHNKDDLRERVEQAVQTLADRGFRALGVSVAVMNGAADATPKWEFIGILSLFDPPRPDTKATIAAAIDNGVEVKMVTGDQTAIAKETCRELGMGTNILNTEVLNDKKLAAADLDKIILDSHGFAEVMPEHKFQIVDRLRQQGHVTGMTGDGVNDAPALKRADIGIAVQGATDAAKAAADIVLIEEGLSVIIDAIFRSRKIFQRMRNYTIYRISCTLQLLFFFFFAIIAFNPNDSFFYGPNNTPSAPIFNPPTSTNLADSFHYSSFYLPVISLVIITILNDGTMITISHDKVIPEKRPQRWAMFEVTVISVCLSLVACLSSLILLLILMRCNYYNPGGWVATMFASKERGYLLFQEVQACLYLKISLSDFLTLFAGRTRTWFWERRPGYALAAAAVFATGSSTLLALFWNHLFGWAADLTVTNPITKEDVQVSMLGLSGSGIAALSVWLYCLIWFVLQDIAKVITYYFLAKFTNDDEARAKDVSAKSKLTAMMDAERHHARTTGKTMGREVSMLGSADAANERATELEARLRKLEHTVSDLLKTKQ